MDVRRGAMSLAAKLKALRAQRKMTLQEVADELKVSKPHVWELERGTSKNPSADTLLKLSKLYGISIDDLLGNAVDSNDSPELAALFRSVSSAHLSTDEVEAVSLMVAGALETLKARRNLEKGN